MQTLFAMRRQTRQAVAEGRCPNRAGFKAQAIAEHVQRRREAQGKGGTVYRCACCDQWHIGRVEPS